jgi:diguanylate cyclase (GGDEF)-like protein
MGMDRKKMFHRRGMLCGIAVIQLVFVVIIMVLGGVGSYIDQMNEYERKSEEAAARMSCYLEGGFQADGQSFIEFQEYFMDHKEKIKIPYDESYMDWRSDEKKYEDLLKKKYPGLRPGIDIAYKRMDDETREAHAIYRFKYWLHMFWQASETSDAKYIYYMVPSEKPYHMIYVFDMDYNDPEIVEDEKMLLLGDDVVFNPDEHDKIWKAWVTGELPAGHDVYDNEYGNTYAYYYPVYVDGKKMGIIGTEIDIDEMKRTIIKSLVGNGVTMLITLLIVSAISLWIINYFYISRIKSIEEHVKEYTDKGKVKTADMIEKEGSRNGVFDDEISFLAKQTAEMIRMLEGRMNSLSRAERNLSKTRSLARTDALTGILNKTAYDEAIKLVESRGDVYGIAVIDLNNLKRINDTYGHERGDIYIKGLVNIVLPLFGESHIYRVGGDEFAVILEEEALWDISGLEKKFDDLIKISGEDVSRQPWERVSAAIGIAMYDERTDESAADVFARADKAMYDKKREMKRKN